MRNRAILMLGLAVVFAVVAAFLAQSWLRGQVVSPIEQTVIVQEAPKPPETTIVVARQPLFYGNELTRQNVREIPWLADDLPTGTFEKIEDLFVDDQTRVVLRTMEQNEPVLDTKISGDDRAATLSAIIPMKMRAITIRVNDIVGVAGYIIPSDRVPRRFGRGGIRQKETADSRTRSEGRHSAGVGGPHEDGRDAGRHPRDRAGPSPSRIANRGGSP